jgi:hypothetical protein
MLQTIQCVVFEGSIFKWIQPQRLNYSTLCSGKQKP